MTQPSDYSAPQGPDEGAYTDPVAFPDPPAEFGGDPGYAEPGFDAVVLDGAAGPDSAVYDTEPHDIGSDFAASGSGDSSKTDAAKGEADALKGSAQESGQKVADTAKEQASQVKAEAGHQAKQLLNSGLAEASSQAGAQQKRLAGGLQSVVDELGSMAANSDKSGPMTELAQQAAEQGGQLARKLENSDPSQLLDEVRSFARRRPVAFLGIAALSGFVVGRLTRGLAADAKSSNENSSDRDSYGQGSFNQGSYDQGSFDQGSFDQGARYRDGNLGSTYSPSVGSDDIR